MAGFFLSITFSRLSHTVTPTRTSFLFAAECDSIVCLLPMQKNILVDYGLRRITFLIAQEVSPPLGAS